MKRKPRVVITNHVSRVDYSPAEVWGEPVTLSDKLYSFANDSPTNRILARDIATQAAEFDDSLDFVLPSGSALSTSLFFVSLFNRGVRVVKVLMWNGNDQLYRSGLLDLRVAMGGKV